MSTSDKYRDGSVEVQARIVWEWDGDHTDADEYAMYESIDSEGKLREVSPRVAVLPHQCGGWFIGDATRVRALIRDLEALLPLLESSR